MSEAASQSILTRMVARPAPAAPAADIGPFAQAAAKAAKAALEPLLSAKIEAAANDPRRAALAELLRAAPEEGIYYWICEAGGAPAALFSVSPGFAGALTERLLGGELSSPASDAPATPLFRDMAASMVDVMAPALALAFEKLSAGAAPALRRGDGARLKADAIGELEEEDFCLLRFDLRYEGGEAESAFEIAFAARLIEGMTGPAGTGAPSPARSDQWPEKMKRAVLACEIPLAVILESFTTSIGDLSRLAVDQVIDLDPDRLGALDIAAVTDDGPVSIARGRLGAVQSRKAVKLTTPIDPDFLRGL